MEIKTIKAVEVSGNMGESSKAGIDESSMPFMFEMLSRNLYQKPIESIVREITSNCFDSHIEAGVDDPVVIKKAYEEEGTCISFIDVGVGLSPLRMMKIYMNYFSSTKRSDNALIGGFGLGSKSPLSYTDYFYINTIYNGLKYEYIFSRGEQQPELDSIHGYHDEPLEAKVYKKLKIETLDGTIYLPVVKRRTYNNPIGIPTSERNGTEIKIVIDGYSDEEKFRQALKSQLCYFDNVYFQDWGIDNEYKIYEKNLFRYRNKNQYSNEMHILFGKVAYPIDWEAIGLERIKVPIGVKFEIGELIVTPNRESLRYTDEIKELVNKRILEAYEELKTLYVEERAEYDDFWEWIKEKDERKKIKFSDEDILYLTGVKELTPTYYKPFKDFKLRKDIFKHFSFSHFGFRPLGKFDNKKLATNYHDDITQAIRNNYGSIVLCDNQVFQEVKNHYYNRKNAVLKEKPNFKYLYSRYFDYEETTNDSSTGNLVKNQLPLGWAKQLYTLYKEMCDLAYSRIHSYYSDDLDKEYIDNYNAEKRANNAALQRKLAGKVFVKLYRTQYSFSEKEWTIAEIEKLTQVVIYGHREDAKLLKQAIQICYTHDNFTINHEQVLNHKACLVISTAQTNAKHFKNKKNMIHVKDLYGDNIVFRRLASAFKIVNIQSSLGVTNYEYKQYAEQFDRINSNISLIMLDLAKHHTEVIGSDLSELLPLKDNILAIAEKYNLFYEPIEIKLRDIDNYFKGVEILKYTNIDERTLPIMIKMLYNNKKKINLEYYQKYIEEPIINQRETQLSIIFVNEEEQTEQKETKFVALTRVA